MLAKDLIESAVIPLKTSDTGAMVLQWMDEYKVSHLPIVNNEEFLGLITESDVAACINLDEPIGNCSLSISNAYVNQKQHIYDVVKLVSMMGLSLLPVVDDEKRYLGVITLPTLIQKFANISAINNPGGIIVLELNVNDYTMKEIADIIESNDAKILSSYITSHPDSTKLDVTLKINKMDVSGILQTFSRYNYNVKASFYEADMLDDLHDRYESLMKFLDI